MTNSQVPGTTSAKRPLYGGEKVRLSGLNCSVTHTAWIPAIDTETMEELDLGWSVAHGMPNGMAMNSVDRLQSHTDGTKDWECVGPLVHIAHPKPNCPRPGNQVDLAVYRAHETGFVDPGIGPKHSRCEIDSFCALDSSTFSIVELTQGPEAIHVSICTEGASITGVVSQWNETFQFCEKGKSYYFDNTLMVRLTQGHLCLGDSGSAVLIEHENGHSLLGQVVAIDDTGTLAVVVLASYAAAHLEHAGYGHRLEVLPFSMPAPVSSNGLPGA